MAQFTPPSDLDPFANIDDESMSFVQSIPSPPASGLSIRRLGIVHRRALHSLSGAVLTWVYLALLFVALPVALSLIVVWVGVPMLIGVLAAIRGCAALERRLAVTLLDVAISAPPRVTDMRTTRMGQLRALVTHGATWRAMGYTFVRFITGLIAFIVATVFGGTSVAFFSAPFVPDSLTVNDWHPLGGWSSWWAPVLGAAIAMIGWYICAAIGQVHGWIAPVLLGSSEADRLRALEGRTAKLSAQTQLARELHDSVGHTMTSVVVQASAARRVFDSNPTFAREALGEIETSARQALNELDYMIGVLRSDQVRSSGELVSPKGRAHVEAASAHYSPLPTLVDVERLIATAQRNGLPITHTLTGNPSSVPMQLSREAFRIVQEGLTNVTKHAPSANTNLVIDIGVQELTIMVTNAIRLANTSLDVRSSGNGLRGISERVSALGGVVWVGPVEDTHVLRAVVPFKPFDL
jgi:signal transduction histidine kinase